MACGCDLWWSLWLVWAIFKGGVVWKGDEAPHHPTSPDCLLLPSSSPLALLCFRVLPFFSSSNTFFTQIFQTPCCSNAFPMDAHATAPASALPPLDAARLDEMVQDMDTANSPTFHQLPFNPQQFVNDVFNAANDILEEAFDVMEENAPQLLRISSEQSLEALNKGFDAVFNSVQGNLDKNLCLWEAFCLANCFAIPDHFPTLQENVLENCSDNTAIADGSKEEEVDAELEAVRSKLAVAGKESAKMRRELRSLERCLAVKNKHNEALQDAMKQLDRDSEHTVFEEVIRTATALREKLNKLKAERVQSPRGIRLTKTDLKGFRSSDLAETVESFGPRFSGKNI